MLKFLIKFQVPLDLIAVISFFVLECFHFTFFLLHVVANKETYYFIGLQELKPDLQIRSGMLDPDLVPRDLVSITGLGTGYTNKYL